MKINLQKNEEIKPKKNEIIIGDDVASKRNVFKRIINKKNSYLIILTLFLIMIFFLLLFLFIIIISKQKNKKIGNSVLNNIFNNLNQTFEKYNWEDEKLVIHALGKYKNTIYTNAYESINYWYHEKKMKLMEADFLLTKDNHIVLAHDFSHLHKTPTLEEFKQSYAKGHLTPMTFEDLVIFMKNNEDLFIITDTKYNDIPNIKIEFDEMNDILNRYRNVRERFIIEIYNEIMFLYLKNNYNFKYFMFTLYKRWKNKNYRDLENIFQFCAKNKINAIIMYKHLFNSQINDLSKKYSIPIYLHTENNIIKIAEFLKDAKGIFTDEVDKSSLNKYISNLTKLLL